MAPPLVTTPLVTTSSEPISPGEPADVVPLELFATPATARPAARAAPKGKTCPGRIVPLPPSVDNESHRPCCPPNGAQCHAFFMFLRRTEPPGLGRRRESRYTCRSDTCWKGASR